ncbi:hypothetical protein ABZY90_19815 [Streptomyces sp. NPDC006422]|uniref:DUF6197 family protein n=1 Tax=unclassified Streptomyces TaxID=2593676 RepID=UPI0033B71F78
MISEPTNLPAAQRRPVLVTGFRVPVRATSLSGVYRTAARLIARQGLHQGDLLPDPFNRTLTTPHAERALSLTAALHCATSGDPHRHTPLSDLAVRRLARRLVVDEQGPYADDDRSLATHVENWGDVEGRTTASAVAVLEAAADACEVSA